MKFKLKALTAAVALGIAGQASAALDLPSTGNGELFLTVWDTVTGESYIRGLDIRINDFMVTEAPNSSNGTIRDPEAGMRLDATTNAIFAGDTLFASTFGNNSAANLKWNIVAADSNNNPDPLFPTHINRLVTTSTATNASQISLTGTGLAGAVNRVEQHEVGANLLNGCDVNPSCVSTDTTEDSNGNKLQVWGDSFGGNGSVKSAGTGFGSLFFYYIGHSSAGGVTQIPKTLFANSQYTATWTLTSDGSVAYNLQAVPIPAAVWLFGSALVGLVGVARRRTHSAALA